MPDPILHTPAGPLALTAEQEWLLLQAGLLCERDARATYDLDTGRTMAELVDACAAGGQPLGAAVQVWLAAPAPVAALACRRYLAVWDASHLQPGEQVVDAGAFGAAAGYSAADRRAIAALPLGELWECPDRGPAHTVRRVADAPPVADLARMVTIVGEFADAVGKAPAAPAPRPGAGAAPAAAQGCAHDYQQSPMGYWRCQYCSQERAATAEETVPWWPSAAEQQRASEARARRAGDDPQP
ncbi:hypothetical protein [Cupriavidus sp. TMH.W2]|uniref:hypothetical protein n=1 Tax=Cupriavidus sp. TMH.W2 TaxID=3434465 RepID=UPI003D77A312